MQGDLPRQRGESDKSYQARKALHEAQNKKLAARDPNIPTVLHVRFEAVEARIAAIEAKLHLKLRSPDPAPAPAPAPQEPETQGPEESEAAEAAAAAEIDPYPYEDEPGES